MEVKKQKTQAELYIVTERSTTPCKQQGEFMAIKPTIEEVLKYAKGNIVLFIAKYADDLPKEHKQEIEQTVYLRLIEAYESIDPDLGWKSFVYNHCRGGVLDYVKFGKGFEENKWSLQKEEKCGSKNISKVFARVSATEKEDGTEEGIEDILARCGISNACKEQRVKINWSLVACMAAQDEIIHAFAKYIIGFSVDEISTNFGLCRARISQLLQAFSDRFDDPLLIEDAWTLQMIYAFGLCKFLGLPDIDQSEVHKFPIGWGSRKVDLYDEKPFETDSQRQMSLDLDVG